ncbi:DUF4169 family protein [Phenylobacterium sp.]|uniref:DUF4169 family protein n=1 Tax=Phenylobacterium sp. TaxID=1871053 RepID=UPI00286B5E66|nr:DUF4169 family protein [Phenylobacterium sp.]
MADLINFNKAKKAKARDQDRSQAARNRVAFGRTKAEKTASKMEASQADRALDGTRRED